MTGSESPPAPVDWQARFEANDAPWERNGPHPALKRWLGSQKLRAGLRVYVPGCGRGHEPEVLAKAGLAVTASDTAPSAAAFQRERLAAFDSAIVIQADSLAWRPERAFDILYEQTFLCAIHPRQRNVYEAMAYDVLKPGGRLLALFMQKDERGGPPYGCTVTAMRSLFNAERWTWQDPDSFVAFPHPGLNGKPEIASVLTRR